MLASACQTKCLGLLQQLVCGIATLTTRASVAGLQPLIPPAADVLLPPAARHAAAQVKSAMFLNSAYTPEHLAASLNSLRRQQVAVLGRSNVGKSSLVNYLVGSSSAASSSGSKNLAKVSGTPGRTCSINTYLINSSWCFVDCPGYGYAATSKTARAEWHSMTRTYLKHASRAGALVDVLLLVDASLPPKEMDVAGVEWLTARHYPVTLVYTKCDKKPKKGQPGPADNVAAFQQQLDSMRLVQPVAQFPTCAVGSSGSKFGRQELLGWLSRRIAAHTAAQQAAAVAAAAAS